ncbi:MAG: IMPACT family protein [Lachnospiraceae bacterium]|jgi:uncharacterized YigZ family protein|nr:IMPACT family protein [Lachnospiraceae bacterium]
MAVSFRTVIEPGNSEISEKKSRFLGLAVHCATAEEAEKVLEAVRKQHYEARHHCWARILRSAAVPEGVQDMRTSDDGEPQGTAGRPILEVMKGFGVTDTLVVVTRYFGGTLLGTGGLARAYTEAARTALTAAVTEVMQRCDVLELCVPYPQAERVQKLLRERGIADARAVYTENVTITVHVPEEQTEALCREMTDLTAGTAGIKKAGNGYFPALKVQTL